MSVGRDETFPRHGTISLFASKNHGSTSVEIINTEKMVMAMSGMNFLTHGVMLNGE
jgi:hypothetical protein